MSAIVMRIRPQNIQKCSRLSLCRGFASITPEQASLAPHGDIEGVFTLTLNRPEAKNSLGHQLMKQLREILHSSSLDRAKCLLIQSGIDGTFCAGADLKVPGHCNNA